MSDYPIKSPRKLIEVALPLEAINDGCQQEKNPFLKGHPRAVHLWWARRPLAAARAVIFAQLVNDPGYQQGGGFKYGKNKKDAAIERKRLFKIIEDIVRWENITNKQVMECARAEIRRSWREVCELNKDHPQAAELFNPDKLPALHDPFAGGGAIPLEAQRLGLEAFASDLNPVAVLINKAMIEIPPKFAGRPPVFIASKNTKGGKKDLGLEREWPGAAGLSEDIRRYGAWMQAEAQRRIGHIYPPAKVTDKMARLRPDLMPLVGQELPVIAWLWVRTVKSPNPAFSHVHVPLASSFILAVKEGKAAYIQPVIEGDSYQFVVKCGTPPPDKAKGTTAGKRAAFLCLISGTPIDYNYIRAEGKAGRLGQKLLAIVAEGPKGRVYLDPNEDAQSAATRVEPSWKPDMPLPDNPRDFKTPNYGLTTYKDLFTPRQMIALTTFSDLVEEAKAKVKLDAISAGMEDDSTALDAEGTGAPAYAEAVAVFLACGISQLSRYSCSNCSWNKTNENVVQAFGRQAMPMVWDFAEAHPLLGSLSIGVSVGWVASATEPAPASISGHAIQCGAQDQELSLGKFVSTDPPYYDNIGYADLSDFFYIWLRRTLKPIFPALFATMTVPKAAELVATPYRHGSKEEAEEFFLNGMTQTMQRLANQAHPEAPVTIYYAFKQSETDHDDKTSSTGWVTFLAAVLKAGFHLTGTWPIRTEKTDALKREQNALASSIVLVCRKRPADAPSISRREFIRELNGVLPEALDEMTKGSGDERSPVAPVDLSQAIIGPGMAVFSKYAAVLEADGSPMSVRTALQLINRFLAEDDFDADTQFCLHWFEQHGWTESVFGEADVLARSKSTSVDAMKEAGVLQSGSGKVRLLKWAEYPTDWDPRTDKRTPVWEAMHHLIRAHKQGGDTSAGPLLAALSGKAEAVRQLAYRLYTLCERQGRAEDARAYNELITSWTGIENASRSTTSSEPQGEFNL